MTMRGLSRVRTIAADHLVSGLYVREEVLEDGPLLGPALLFVHGRCHGSWAYRRWSSYFAGVGWRCFALSLRNHPGSRQLDVSAYLRTSVADYVDDLRAVLEWAAEPCVVIGHSLGGFVAQKAAERTGLAGLVLVASVGPGQLGRHADDFPDNEPVVDRGYYLERDQPDLARRVVPESPLALNEMRGRTPVDRSLVACPVLVVGGERDDTGVHDPRAVARFYDCPCLIIPGGTHDLMLDDTALVTAAAISSWLLSTFRQPAIPAWDGDVTPPR
jgi:pimeloyl-ACP methyl ester carboxylesterase